VNPDSAATVARLRQRIEQLREAARESRQKLETATREREEAQRDRWSLQKEVATGKRAAEDIESMQSAQAALKRREAELRDGLREVLHDLTALSRYLQP